MSRRSPIRTKILTGPTYYDMLIGALEALRSERDEVNRLNVYPVPDGDTGTNMLLTLESAINRVADPSAPLGELAAQASMGSLMGARGNSGVILSQFFRGMAASLGKKDVADPAMLTEACQSGVRAAYSAVMRPVEGTILTVAREAAEAAGVAAKDGGDLVDVLECALKKARETLLRTPEMLDVLREAGVVDAGGQGLVHIFEGALAVLGGTPVAVSPRRTADVPATRESSDVELDFPFDLVFLLDTEDPRAASTDSWEGWGDSLVLVREGDLVKVHIHTDRPVPVLSQAMEMGNLIECEVHNMQTQVAQNKGNIADAAPVLAEDEIPTAYVAEPGPLAFIPIAMGDGVMAVFRSLGAVEVVRGGATMNPSTEDILRAIEESGARRLVLLPNNSNLILACEQARDMSEAEVEVLPTVTVAQGLSAAMAAASACSDADADAILDAMQNAINGVSSVEITYAVEDRSFSGMQLSRGDIIGFVDSQLTAVGSSPVDVLVETLASFVDSSAGSAAILVGADVTPAQVEELRTLLHSSFEHLEFDFLPGGQEHYYFVAAVH